LCLRKKMLYRKYRPATFSEVVGQEHVVKTLRGALIAGRVGHAYLFTGHRGTGKTTLARLFAKALNCEKRTKEGDCDNSCSFCLAITANNSLDLIEIDAASNRGIDEIRSLKESASVAAPGGKYKIFIIDEVHMLTKDAFNALLKVLEEPPAHVIFILATTEPHKILPTVLSRVQRFDFKKLTLSQITQKIKEISKSEKIKIEDGGLLAIAVSADGALRDAEVALSKVMASSDKAGQISQDDVYDILGLVPIHYHPEFLGYLVSGDKQSALDFVNRINSGGIDLENFTAGFIEYLRKVMIHSINPAILASVGQEFLENDKKVISAQNLTADQMIRMLNIFVSAKIGIKSSPIPQLPLELAVLEVIK
jgi:DNA polymerase III subunit gamma/tau